MQAVWVQKGRRNFYKTDEGTDLYIVLSGRLKAVLTDDEGDEIILAMFDKGAFFGELSLLDGKGRSATIIAATDCELAVLSKGEFLDLLSRDPRISIELMITLVDRLRRADEMIESLAFLDVGERLARALLDMNKGSEKDRHGYIRIRKLTHKELAGRIGSSLEAVTKCMKLLSTNGIIREAEGHIDIACDAIERLKTLQRRLR